MRNRRSILAILILGLATSVMGQFVIDPSTGNAYDQATGAKLVTLGQAGEVFNRNPQNGTAYDAATGAQLVVMPDGSIPAGQLAATLDLSGKTVTLPDASITASKLDPGAVGYTWNVKRLTQGGSPCAGMGELSIIYEAPSKVLHPGDSVTPVFKTWADTGYFESANGIDWTAWTGGPGGTNQTYATAALSYCSVIKVGSTYHLFGVANPNNPLTQVVHHATSADGLSFTRVGTTDILPTAGGWDAGCVICNLSVLYDSGTWYMLYDVGGYAGARNSAFCQGLATSADGTAWVKKTTPIGATLSGPVINNGYCWTGPDLHKIGSTFYLWIAGGHDWDTPTDIWLWTSTDCQNWAKTDIMLPRLHAGVGTTTEIGGTITDPCCVEATVNGITSTYLFFASESSQYAPGLPGATNLNPKNPLQNVDFPSFVAVAQCPLATLVGLNQQPVCPPKPRPFENIVLSNTYIDPTAWHEPGLITPQYHMQGVIYQGKYTLLHNYADPAAFQSELANLFLGADAGNFTMTSAAIDNFGFGPASLRNLTTGYSNVAVGPSALNANTTGYQNIGIGTAALATNTTGVANIAIGYDALLSITTGSSYNLAIGYNSLQGIVGASSNNIAIGDRICQNATSSGNMNGNTIVGSWALPLCNNNSYGNNSVLGYDGLHNLTSGYSNISIGASTYLNAASDHDCIIIGNGTTGKGINTTAIGTTATVGTYIMGGVTVLPIAILNSGNAIAGAIGYDGTNFRVCKAAGTWSTVTAVP